jgi:hypothetical protein
MLSWEGWTGRFQPFTFLSMREARCLHVWPHKRASLRLAKKGFPHRSHRRSVRTPCMCDMEVIVLHFHICDK